MASVSQPGRPIWPPDPPDKPSYASLVAATPLPPTRDAPEPRPCLPSRASGPLSTSAAPEMQPSPHPDFPPLPNRQVQPPPVKLTSLPVGSASAAPFAPAVSGLSFAAVTAGGHLLKPRFPPILLSPRQAGDKEGKLAVSFSKDEVQMGSKRFNFSLVAKFTFGKPPLAEIQRAFQAHWKISGRATISGVWDSRHVLIILDSEEDVTSALSCPLRKVKQSMFRLFRWSIDYNPKKESTTTTAWVRLPRLPLPLYDSAYIGEILSTFAHFLDVDDRTKACLSLNVARACIEIDATQSIPDKVWVNMGEDHGYWQVIEVETKLAYCSKCRVHGHDVTVCRKAKASMEHKRENGLKSDYGPDILFNVTAIKDNLEVVVAAEKGESCPKEVPLPNLKDIPSTELSIIGSTDKAHDVSSQDDHLAMVIYNGPCVSSNTPHVRAEKNVRVFPPLSLEGGQSSQADQGSDPPVSIQSNHRSLEVLLQVEAPGDVSPPISEWIPSKKKRKNKGKKVVSSESESALERASRVSQPNKAFVDGSNSLGLRLSSRSKKSSEKSDFVYNANGKKSGKGKVQKKVSFNEIADVICYVEGED